MSRADLSGRAESTASSTMLYHRWSRWIGFPVLALLTLPILLTLYYAVLPPPISGFMIGRFLTGGAVDYRWVGLRSISPALASAVITAEDARFCEHHGIDWPAVREVVGEAFDGDEQPIRGASTIAMQTAKNLFLWEGRSIVRKAMEMPLALWIDTVWSKKRLIEVYLNIAEWAPGVYGAEAAAREHFGKSAKALTPREAALLASVLPNPIKRSAGKPSRAVRHKASVIERRVLGMGSLLACVRI